MGHAMKTSLSPIQATDFGPAQARHLLLRSGFGSPPSRVAELAQLAPEDAVKQIVHGAVNAQPAEPPEVDPDVIRPLNDEERQVLIRARREGDEAARSEVQRGINMRRAEDRQMVSALRRWWVELMADNPTPLREKLVLLWHSHFATRHRNVRDTYLMYRQNTLFREHAAGSFADLARGVVHDPAMLKFLNNDQNNKRRPNENLAREFMELFTLGEGNYAERDIKQGAKALTGYGVDDNDFVFRENRHDGSKKTVLGSTGRHDGDGFVDILLGHPACPKYLALKLYRHFVADVSDYLNQVPGPERKVILKLAVMLRKNGYQVAPVLETLFASQHFYDDAIVGKKIKSPVQLVIGTADTLGTPLRSPGTLSDALTLMGQSLFDPPSVAGWPGGRDWINTSTLFTRQNTCTYLITGKDPRKKKWSRKQIGYDPLALLDGLESREPDDVVTYVASFMLGDQVPDERLKPLYAFMRSRSKGVTADSLVGLLSLMAAMPEYQLC